MKKIAIVSLLSLAAVSALAQTSYDALQMSDNEYFGTARTLAMGNAFTALGGDPGSFGINPAGSAVNRYAQFTITPNLSIAATGAGYSADPLGTAFGPDYQGKRSRITLPNYGVSAYMNLGRRRGLKGISIGFVGNATANYLDRVSAAGTNPHTSFMAEMADGLSYDGVPYTTFSPNPAANYDNTNLSWREALGWNTGMFYHPDGTDDANYLGTSEVDAFVLGGPLNQRWGRETSGYKHDMVLNFGMNFSDRFFLGFNLGMVGLEMKKDAYLMEEAVNPADFPNNFDGTQTYFKMARLRDQLTVDGSGVYGKIGFIYVPTPFLRFGAAIQTPTVMNVHEYFQTAGSLEFSDSRFSASDKTPRGEGEYRIISPYRVNAGAAVNFGLGVISADYEMTDYGTMRFRSVYNDPLAYDYFYENEDIVNTYGIVHALRLGFEVKPAPELALRAGYNVSTVPEIVHDADNRVRQSASVGLGYSSGGSFYCDLALRGLFRAKEYYQLYNNYMYDDEGRLVHASPTVRIDSSLFDIAMTFGWRF